MNTGIKAHSLTPSDIFKSSACFIMYNHPSNESRYYSLKSPSNHEYHIHSPKVIRSSKKIFPSISIGNNAEFPEYLKNKNLPYSKYSVDHVPRYQSRRRIFEGKLNARDNSPEKWLYIRKKVTIPSHNPTEANDSGKVSYISRNLRNEYERRYNLRSFDIISNLDNVPYNEIPKKATKYFAHYYRASLPIKEKVRIEKENSTKREFITLLRESPIY